MQPIIQTKNLSKWYGNILGISEINLDIMPGVHGLLGPNGAGKSTLLKVMMGFLHPNLGSIAILDQTPGHSPELNRQVGYCPEVDVYYHGFTGWEFVLFRAQIFGYGEKESLEALQIIGLSEHMHKKVSSYSLGMRQRLKLAAAIVHNPQILILDEPLRGIDPLWRLKIIRLVRDLGNKGKTVLISSHILPEIEAMTHQIILIHQGKVFAKGEMEHIRTLLNSHPHQICIKAPSIRRLAAHFIQDTDIIGMNFSADDANQLTVTTHQQDFFYDKLLSIVVNEGYDLHELISTDDNLQNVFDYLIGK